MSTFDYTGYKLGEKKVLKENEVTHAPAQKTIQDKLGADWKLVIDWPTFHKLTCETAANERARSEREWVPNRVYQNYVPAIAAEIAQWDADTCEAVNEAVTDKQIVITMDTETVDNRYSVKVGKSIEVLMQQDKICYEYPYSDAYTVTAAVEKAL